MDRIRIPKTDDHMKDNVEPSPAWGWDARGHIFIRCICGECCLIDHEILPNGDVNPSLWHDDPKCGWHIMATLDGWGM